jgi:RNA polymerase sigma-70 factor (ECF subfamily)
MPAWHEFFCRYDALLEQWCGGHSLSGAAVDEIRENVWIELAHRVRTFRYDPQKSFRGWLREMCRSRTVDFLRKRQREARNVRSLDDAALSRAADRREPVEPDGEGPSSTDPLLHELAVEAKEAQAAAQKRVKPQTWDIFWQIAIADRPIREVAAEYGMKYTAAFRAYARTARILREEGNRRRGQFLGRLNTR